MNRDLKLAEDSIRQVAIGCAPTIRLVKAQSDDLPTLVVCPIGWISLSVRFELRGPNRIRGWHRVTPLFASASAAFDIAVGDISRPAMLGLLAQRSWRLDDGKTVRRLIDVIAREVPVVRHRFETIDAFADNASAHPDDLSGSPDLVEALLTAGSMTGRDDPVRSLRNATHGGASPARSTELLIAEARQTRMRLLADFGLERVCPDGSALPDDGDVEGSSV